MIASAAICSRGFFVDANQACLGEHSTKKSLKTRQKKRLRHDDRGQEAAKIQIYRNTPDSDYSARPDFINVSRRPNVMT